MYADHSEVCLKTKQVREGYGNASDMWIVRRIRDSGLPGPVYLGAQRFWRERDLVAWEKQQIKEPPTP